MIFIYLERVLLLKCFSLRFVRMNYLEAHRFCKACGEILRGRRDQKYCSDHCRNAFNNHAYAVQFAAHKRINGILRNNQQVLCRLSIGKRKPIALMELLKNGFQLAYHTHTEQGKNGQTIYFCYDYGYLRLDEQMIQIITPIVN